MSTTFNSGTVGLYLSFFQASTLGALNFVTMPATLITGSFFPLVLAFDTNKSTICHLVTSSFYEQRVAGS